MTSIDNFATGHRANLDEVRRAVGEAAWARHRFVEGDIADRFRRRRLAKASTSSCIRQRIGSVPRSDQSTRLAAHRANVTGFLNVLVAARDAGAKRFVYAASSSTYGDSATLPKVEDASAGRCHPMRSRSTSTSSTPTCLRAATA